jgi:hypothetical protein
MISGTRANASLQLIENRMGKMVERVRVGFESASFMESRGANASID